MAKSPETDIDYGEIRNHLADFLKEQSIEPETLSRVLKDLTNGSSDSELDETKFDLERFYGEGKVSEPKCGLIRVVDSSGGSNFYNKNRQAISPTSFIYAEDFISSNDRPPQATVWVESNPQPDTPCDNPNYRTVEMKYIDRSGNIIPSQTSLSLFMKISNRQHQTDHRQSVSFENFQQPFPGCYSLWSEKTLNFVQSKIDSLDSLIDKSSEEVETARQRKKMLNSKHIIPSEMEYTGPKSTASGRICIYQHEDDTINRLEQLLLQRAPNIQIDYSDDIEYFSQEKPSEYQEQQLENIQGVVLFPTYFDLVDEDMYEDYFYLKINSNFLRKIIGECHKRGIPVLLMPDYPAIPDLYDPIVTDFVQRVIQMPNPQY